MICGTAAVRFDYLSLEYQSLLLGQLEHRGKAQPLPTAVHFHQAGRGIHPMIWLVIALTTRQDIST
jgi:hypothetical protein